MILTPELRKLYREQWIKAKAGGRAPLNENVDNLFDTLDELERQNAELRDAVLDEAYNIARGGDDRFQKHGASQMYWKGRSDAAREIRERKTK